MSCCSLSTYEGTLLWMMDDQYGHFTDSHSGIYNVFYRSAIRGAVADVLHMQQLLATC